MSLFLILCTLLFSQAQASHHPGFAHRLRKRFTGDATYYDVGLGACGGTNVKSDFVVALNAPQFDEAGTGYPNPSCGKSLTITHNGKTATAIVVDKCPGCAYGSLDLSQGLFEYFESTDVGRFLLSWSWGGSSPAPAPSPTSSTYVAPAPTTSAAPVPTTTTSPTTSQAAAQTTSSRNPSTTSSSTSSSLASSYSGSVAPSSTGQPDNNNNGELGIEDNQPGNVLVMQEAIMNLGSLIRRAAVQS